jgi:predicted transposase/invertase (TIGR01784 family)
MGDFIMNTVPMEDIDLLEPSRDFIFRTVFGSEEHKAELISLLNAVLQNDPVIRDVTIENGDIPKDLESGKSIRLDLTATSDKSTKISIEIQCHDVGHIVNRSAFYQSRRMPTELKEGEEYDSLPDMISIWFTTYNETNRKYHTSEAVYMYKESKLDPVEIASEKFRTFIIELPKVDLSNAKASNMFDVWAYFLKNPQGIPEEFLKIEEVNKAMHTLSYVSQNPEMRRIYNARLKAQNDAINEMSHAKNEGREEGIAIGEKRGEAKGEKRGEKRGKMEIACRMLKKGVDLEDISEFTGLSIKEIKSLRIC